MVLEVVSTSSVQKDYRLLRRAYWEADIREYWLVDARKAPVKFEILRHGARLCRGAQAGRLGEIDRLRQVLPADPKAERPRPPRVHVRHAVRESDQLDHAALLQPQPTVHGPRNLVGVVAHEQQRLIGA